MAGSPGSNSVPPAAPMPKHFCTCTLGTHVQESFAVGCTGSVPPEQQQHGPHPSPQAQQHFFCGAGG
jgi:hypothetical protein